VCLILLRFKPFHFQIRLRGPRRYVEFSVLARNWRTTTIRHKAHPALTYESSRQVCNHLLKAGLEAALAIEAGRQLALSPAAATAPETSKIELFRGWSLALIGNASGRTLGVRRKSRSEAFSIRRLGGSRWRLRRTRCAMGFERQFGSQEVCECVRKRVISSKCGAAKSGTSVGGKPGERS
jgi:hypothetical protein